MLTRCNMLALWLSVVMGVTTAMATPIVYDDMEAYTVGDITCATLQATGPYSDCLEKSAPNASDATIVSSAPACGPMPSGSKAIKWVYDSTTGQSDGGVTVGDANLPAYDNWMPADSWFQVAVCIPYSGGELSYTAGRTLKFLYPCPDPYACGANGNRQNYWLLVLGTSTYLPLTFGAQPSGNPSGGNLYIELTNAIGANYAGDLWPGGHPHWAGYAAAGAAAEDAHKMGQTNLSEWIKPNRWNVLKCHPDFSNAAAAAMDCWIGEVGQSLTQVVSLHGGTTLSGSAFTWTVPEVRGNRAVSFPSTLPANNTTLGGQFIVYVDDFMIATAESDLPNYAGGGTPGPGTRPMVPGIFLRRAELDEAIAAVRAELAQRVDELNQKWGGICRVVGQTHTTWAARMRREIPC